MILISGSANIATFLQQAGLYNVLLCRLLPDNIFDFHPITAILIKLIKWSALENSFTSDKCLQFHVAS